MGGSAHEPDHVEVRRLETPKEHVIEIAAFERLKPDTKPEGRYGYAECESCWDAKAEIPPLEQGTYTLQFSGGSRRTLTVLAEDTRLRALEELEDRLLRGDPIAEPARVFAANCAPAHGAILAMTADGKLAALAGGTNGTDGVPVALAEPPAPTAILVGGDALKGGRAGACTDLVGGDPDQTLDLAAPDHKARGWWLDDTIVRRFPGAGTRATTGFVLPNDLRDWSRTMRTLVHACSSPSTRAPEHERRLLAIDFARHHRPSSGALAIFAHDPHDPNGVFLVFVGANGTTANPDGVSLEVVGNPADDVVVVAGDAAPGGEPGRALGPASALLADGESR
jgi:hypothetical protein